MSDTAGDNIVQPVDEVEARRAVAGLDADLIEQSGLTPGEADAITTALRFYLMGDVDAARSALKTVFVNGTVDDILAQFADDTAVGGDVADMAA